MLATLPVYKIYRFGKQGLFKAFGEIYFEWALISVINWKRLLRSTEINVFVLNNLNNEDFMSS